MENSNELQQRASSIKDKQRLKLIKLRTKVKDKSKRKRKSNKFNLSKNKSRNKLKKSRIELPFKTSLELAMEALDLAMCNLKLVMKRQQGKVTKSTRRDSHVKRKAKRGFHC